jgi:hypothetical protein
VGLINSKTNLKKQTNKLALVSFAFGIVSLLLTLSLGIRLLALFELIFMPMFALTAFILSIIAILQIRKSSDLKGMGWAIAGLVISILPLIGLLSMLLFLFVGGD